MLPYVELPLYKLRVLLLGILFIIVGLFLLIFLVSMIGATSTQATGTGSTGSVSDMSLSNSSNVVAGGMSRMSNAAERTMSSMGRMANNSLRFVTVATTESGKFVVHGGSVIVRGVGSGLAFTGRTVGSGLLFTVRIPGKTLGFISHTSGMNAIIQPADHAPVPVIDPKSPELIAARAAMPATKTVSQITPAANSVIPQWPIHGVITTLFGVPELPYEAIHTGLDISDGRAPGSTPIKPFRPGRVIEAVNSNLGLGNHVVIDHGDGITSVYGHLNSISIRIGQAVDESTILGYEGTTGVSTGTHLHFEIRVNGQATDPHQFISGQP